MYPTLNVMLTQKLLLPLLVMGCLSAAAQTEDLSYVVLNTGERIEGTFKYEHPVMRAPQIKVNEFSVAPNDIEFFRNTHGIFANVSSFNNGKESFALRVKTGPISVFEDVDMDVYGKEMLPVTLTDREERSMLAQGRMDYLMDEEGNVFDAHSYRGLKDAMAFNEAAQKHVRRAQRYRWMRGILAGAGGLLTGVGVVQAGYGAGVTPALVMGVVGFGTNFLFIPAIEDARWQALDAYNSNEGF